MMATAFVPPFTKAVKISPISEQIKLLQVITCDFCESKASFDAYFEGVISEVTVLKRYCDRCIAALNPQGPL